MMNHLWLITTFDSQLFKKQKYWFFRIQAFQCLAKTKFHLKIKQNQDEL